MALSVVKRPKGYALTSTSATGIYTTGSSIITKTSHGLSTGNIIYISTGQAIGFWYVTSLGTDTFNIREYSGATVFTFYGAGTFTYYTTENTGHGWNCVHLPIVYKLASTLWPTNSVDTARTVSSFANDNGYVKLTLSGAIKSDVSELEFIEITGNQAGVYQVLGFYSTSILTIDLAYNSNMTWAGSTVQYYYQNYRAKIRVYAGLAASHYFAGLKPYELITEQSIVPDSDGIVTINVADYLKDKIETLKNNLNLASLPNNIDAFCNFYITYAEAYDYSDGGYGILDYVESYTDDSSSTGIAVNAKLPFKNVHSGYLTEYVYLASAASLPKWLTPSLYPRLSVGQYFDISFINTFGTIGEYVRREVLLRGVVQAVFQDSVSAYGVGVYRHAISQSIYLEDQIKLTVWTGSGPYTQTGQEVTIEVDSTCYTYAINLSWLNYLGGFDYWTFIGFADYGVDILGTKEQTKNIYPSWPESYGEDADTIRYETSRESNQTIVVRAENLTKDQVDDLYRIKTSPLVMIVNSVTDRRTVIPDASSFVYHPQANKLFDLSFTLSLTDNLPSQQA